MTVHPLVYQDYVKRVVGDLDDLLMRHYWGDEVATRSRTFMESCESWAKQGRVGSDTEMLEGEAAEQDWQDQYTTLQQCLTDPNNEVLPEESAVKLAQLHTKLRNKTLGSLVLPLTDIKATALRILWNNVITIVQTNAGDPDIQTQRQDLKAKSQLQVDHSARIRGPTVRLLTEYDGFHCVTLLDADACFEHCAALSHAQRMSLRNLPVSLHDEDWQEAEEASKLLADTTRMQLLDYQNNTHATDNGPFEGDYTREILMTDKEYTEMMRSYRQAVEGQNQGSSHGTQSVL